MLHRRLLLLLLLALVPSARAITPDQELRRLNLRQETARSKPWTDGYWLRLVYYEKNLFGRYRSPSVDPAFFLSRWGNISPRLEFEAALDGLFYEGPADDSPECRFPERYRWLRQKLGLDPQEFPPRECRKFEDWKAGLDPESVSLVFAAGSLNAPSAVYGAAFLRLHKRGAAGAGLQDPTIGYAPAADRKSGALFAVKGLLGAYPGQFSTIPYELKVWEYSGMADRDLWEFPLSLTVEETDRLLRHCWELGHASFPYKFVSRNSSRQLLPLLDIVRPELNLSRRFHLWVFPSDAVKAVIAAFPAAPAAWRPSLWKTVDWERAQLSAIDRARVLGVARGDEGPPLKKIETLPAARRAAILATAGDYLNWRFYSGQIGKLQLESRTDPLLAALAQTGSTAVFSGAPARPEPVAAGHESLRLGAGLVSTAHGPVYEFRGRLALQDALDDPAGYLPDSALETGSIRLRYDRKYDRFYIKEGLLAHVLSLNPWDDWVRRPSWEFSAGLEQADEAGRQSGKAAVWAMNAAAGLAAEVRMRVRQVWYVMAQADSAFGPALDGDWRLGAGLKAGVLAESGPVRVQAEARYISYALGDTRPLWAGTLAASLRLAKDSSARAEYSWRGKVKEGGVYFHRFLFAP